jgi:hypothetical protein
VYDIVQKMILRGRANSQRHYELYAIDCDENISEDDFKQWFDTAPQAAADLIRSRGLKIFSDRARENRVKIV